MSAKYHSQVKHIPLMSRDGVWARNSNLVEAAVVNNLSIVCFQDFFFFLVEFVYKLQDRW